MQRSFTLLVFVLSGCQSILGITEPIAAKTDAGTDGPARMLVSVEISPDPLTLPIGLNKQLVAVATYSDTTKQDVTSQATFTLDSGTAVTITPGGLVHGVAQGAARVSVTFGGLSGHIDVLVSPVVADHLVISTGDVAIAQQQRVLLRAHVVFSDQTTSDVTFSATWSSDNTAAATADFGEVDTLSVPGTATITASDSGVSSTFVVTVTAAQCHPVVNEVQSGSAVSAADEWVEVYNPCSGSFDVTGWTVDYRSANASGTQDTTLLATLSNSMFSGDTRLLCSDGTTLTCDGNWVGGQMALQNGAVGLRSGPQDTGTLVDSMAYGTVVPAHPFQEGNAALPLANGMVLARLPFDGIDIGDNSADFVLTAGSTPGALNAP